MICSYCCKQQCFYCGDFSESEDPTEDGFHLFEGNWYCEYCTIHHICNQCDGTCKYPCPSCESAHDCECNCMIECTKCGKIFDYTTDIDKWARYCSDKWSLEAREICEDCWEELNATLSDNESQNSSK